MFHNKMRFQQGHAVCSVATMPLSHSIPKTEYTGTKNRRSFFKPGWKQNVHDHDTPFPTPHREVVQRADHAGLRNLRFVALAANPLEINVLVDWALNTNN